MAVVLGLKAQAEMVHQLLHQTFRAHQKKLAMVVLEHLKMFVGLPQKRWTELLHQKILVQLAVVVDWLAVADSYQWLLHHEPLSGGSCLRRQKEVNNVCTLA